MMNELLADIAKLIKKYEEGGNSMVECIVEDLNDIQKNPNFGRYYEFSGDKFEAMPNNTELVMKKGHR
jgi:hypothetical protein